MKKVLILSYFFPPANFAGSYRIYAWARHLHKFGYYPVIITRHWAENETDYTAISYMEEIKKEEHENYTVYRLPYKGSIRDRLVNRFGPKAKLLGKLFSFFQVIGQNYFLRSIPYHNLYNFSRKLLKEQSDIKIVLTSGRPFVHFRLANLLKKEFNNISWIADYRDSWNTDSTISQSPSRRFQRFIEIKSEKKWLQSASLITTVSDNLAQELSLFHSKSVKTVYNGFEPSDYVIQEKVPSKPNEFLIIYNGTLYPSQSILGFLNVFKKLVLTTPNIIFKLIFAGSYPNSTVQSFISLNPNLIISISERLAKHEVINLQRKAQLLLMLGHKSQKGIVSSKIFEYMGLQKPIFLYPSDDGALEQIITKTKSGYLAHNQDEALSVLRSLANEYTKSGFINYKPDKKEIYRYTRKSQTKKLADLICQIE